MPTARISAALAFALAATGCATEPLSLADAGGDQAPEPIYYGSTGNTMCMGSCKPHVWVDDLGYERHSYACTNTTPGDDTPGQVMGGLHYYTTGVTECDKVGMWIADSISGGELQCGDPRGYRAHQCYPTGGACPLTHHRVVDLNDPDNHNDDDRYCCAGLGGSWLWAEPVDHTLVAMTKADLGTQSISGFGFPHPDDVDASYCPKDKLRRVVQDDDKIHEMPSEYWEDCEPSPDGPKPILQWKKSDAGAPGNCEESYNWGECAGWVGLGSISFAATLSLTGWNPLSLPMLGWAVSQLPHVVGHCWQSGEDEDAAFWSIVQGQGSMREFRGGMHPHFVAWAGSSHSNGMPMMQRVATEGTWEEEFVGCTRTLNLKWANKIGLRWGSQFGPTDGGGYIVGTAYRLSGGGRSIEVSEPCSCKSEQNPQGIDCSQDGKAFTEQMPQNQGFLVTSDSPPDFECVYHCTYPESPEDCFKYAPTPQDPWNGPGPAPLVCDPSTIGNNPCPEPEHSGPMCEDGTPCAMCDCGECPDNSGCGDYGGGYPMYPPPTY